MAKLRGMVGMKKKGAAVTRVSRRVRIDPALTMPNAKMMNY